MYNAISNSNISSWNPYYPATATSPILHSALPVQADFTINSVYNPHSLVRRLLRFSPSYYIRTYITCIYIYIHIQWEREREREVAMTFFSAAPLHRHRRFNSVPRCARFMGSPGPVINLSKTDWVTRALGLFQNLHGSLLYAWGLYHRPHLLLHYDRQESSKLAEYYKSNGPNTISPRSRHSRNNTTTTNPHFCHDDDSPLSLSLTLTLSLLSPSLHVSLSLSHTHSHAHIPYLSFSRQNAYSFPSLRPSLLYIIYTPASDYCYTFMYSYIV